MDYTLLRRSSANVDNQIAFYIIYHYMQNALAVGETQEIKENAELTTLKLRVSSNWLKLVVAYICLGFPGLHIHNMLLDCGTKRVWSRSEVNVLQNAVWPLLWAHILSYYLQWSPS